MRILVLTNMYPPHAYGGYEQSCQQVVERWQAAGHEVFVLTSDWTVPGVDAPTEGAGGVRRQLRLYWADHEILDPPLSRRLAIERNNRSVLDRTLTEFSPDVASAWAMGAMSFGLLHRLGERGVPVVSVVCDEWPVYGPVVDAWLRPLSRRPRLGRAVHAVSGLACTPPDLDRLGPACFVSEFLRRACRERSRWGFPDSTVVYSGIEASELYESGIGAGDAGERPWAWRLLYVGRIDPRKGVDTVLRALARCPTEAHLKVVGRGDDRYGDELRVLAADLGIADRVAFSVADRSELAGVYAAADAVVFPSVWEEPFGLVPVEAMACGTPVVATAVGGAAEFLRDGVNCGVFPAGDDERLWRTLQRLATDPALRRRLVAGGRVTAAELGVDQLAQVLEAWHEFAAGPAGRSRPPERAALGLTGAL